MIDKHVHMIMNYAIAVVHPFVGGVRADLALKVTSGVHTIRIYIGVFYTLRTSHIKLVRPYDESSTTYSLQSVDDGNNSNERHQPHILES